MTEGNDAHLKHILIYACDGLNPAHVGNGGVCEGGVGQEFLACQQRTLVAVWTVGGEVSII